MHGVSVFVYNECEPLQKVVRHNNMTLVERLRLE